jgi:hypothetical protein
LFGHPPQRTGSQIKHEVLCAVPDVEPVAHGEEGGESIMLRRVLIAGRFVRREWQPGFWIVPFYPRALCRKYGPHVFSGLSAQLKIEHSWKNQKSIALELGDLAGGQPGYLRNGRRWH